MTLIVYLISFSDANFSSPSVTGKIGVDHTGAKDLDISSDATITQNRLLNSTITFGQSMALSSDAKQLVGLDSKERQYIYLALAMGTFLHRPMRDLSQSKGTRPLLTVKVPTY